MAEHKEVDLNNLGQGTQLTWNFLSSRSTRGIRTHFLPSGVETAKNVATEAKKTAPANFPGLANLPLMSRTVKKLDGGSAIVTETYGRKKGDGGGSTTREVGSEIMSVSTGFASADWYDVTSGVTVITDSTYDGIQNDKKAQYQKQIPILKITLPFLFSTPPISKTLVSALGKINSESQKLFGAKSYPAYTLLFHGFNVKSIVYPDGVTWFPGSWEFLYRQDGWYKIEKVGDDEYIKMLMYPKASLTAQPDDAL